MSLKVHRVRVNFFQFFPRSLRTEAAGKKQTQSPLGAKKKTKKKCPAGRPLPSRRGALVLAGLLAMSLLLFCTTVLRAGRPHGPQHGRRREDQQEEEDETAPRVLAASDDAAAAPSPSPTPTLALLLAPTLRLRPPPKPQLRLLLLESLLLREGGAKGAAAAAPSPSAISAKNNGDEDEEEEEEEEASGDGDGEEARRRLRGQNRPRGPGRRRRGGRLGSVRSPSAAAEPPQCQASPRESNFWRSGATKAIDQSEVDPSSLSGKKGRSSFTGATAGRVRVSLFFVLRRGGRNADLVEEKRRTFCIIGPNPERKGGRKKIARTRKKSQNQTFLFFSLSISL